MMEPTSRSADPAAQEMLLRSTELGAKTAWDRYAAQTPQCGFGLRGLCCQACFMGPCRISPNPTKGAQQGVCGVDGHLIVARNLARAVAAGAAAHSDHGRVVAGLLAVAGNGDGGAGYAVADVARLLELAHEHGIATADRSPRQIAAEVAAALLTQFGRQEGPLVPALRAPRRRRELWERRGLMPRGIDREVVDLLHRTTHGVEADPRALLRAALRAALADGWGGSMIATDASDVLFGAPRAVRSRANLGVLEEASVNILVHGHEPALSEMIVRASTQADMLALAREKGAEGINVAGICCTANEILMRQGMPIAGNYLHQELALLTGAVDLMVVDVQCVMASLPELARCHHTRVVTTSEKAHIPGAERVELDSARPLETARAIVGRAIAGFADRDPAAVRIPRRSMDLVAGFTNENLPRYLGGRFRSGYRPLNDAIAAGRIRGVAGVVGCNTVKCTQDAHHLELTRRLIAQDVLVAHTGCSAIASAKAGLMHPAAALEHAGPGLREVCEAVGIPPVLHLGSCVDNSRILNVCVSMVAEGGLGEDLADLPVVAAAPEAMSEKAITIGFYAVASGIFTVFMPMPRLAGSAEVRRYLEEEVEEETGGRFFFAEDVAAAAQALVRRLDEKRKALKLAPVMHEGGVRVADPGAPRAAELFEPPKGLVALGCGKTQARGQARPPQR